MAGGVARFCSGPHGLGEVGVEVGGREAVDGGGRVRHRCGKFRDFCSVFWVKVSQLAFFSDHFFRRGCCGGRWLGRADAGANTRCRSRRTGRELRTAEGAPAGAGAQCCQQSTRRAGRGYPGGAGTGDRAPRMSGDCAGSAAAVGAGRVAAASLTVGGRLVAYLPTTPQVAQLVAALEGWGELRVLENLQRDWTTRPRALRPQHRMLGHTGFIVSARHFGGKP